MYRWVALINWFSTTVCNNTVHVQCVHMERLCSAWVVHMEPTLFSMGGFEPGFGWDLGAELVNKRSKVQRYTWHFTCIAIPSNDTDD